MFAGRPPRSSLFAVAIMAQQTTAAFASNGAEQPVGWEWWLSNIWAPVIVGGILGAMGAIYGVAERRMRSTAEAAREEAVKSRAEMKRGLIQPVRVPPGDRRNSIILLGLEGSGKTTLIRNLLKEDKADPTQKTEKYELYTGVRQADPKGPKHWLYVSDYTGQNLGTLVAAFAEQQKMPYSAMAYPFVTSLVLMVDFVAPPGDQHEPELQPQAKPDEPRIKRHNEQWSETALDAVFGMLAPEHLQFVCLFVNKLDLMKNRSAAAEDRYRSAFEELRKRLVERSGQVSVDVIFGSAKTGDGLAALEDKLRRHSVAAIA